MQFSKAELDILLDKIMEYECHEMPPLEHIPFFQRLIDTGMAWKIQGGYSNQAINLIQLGYCLRSNN